MPAVSHRVGTISGVADECEDNIFSHESQSAERLSYVGDVAPRLAFLSTPNRKHCTLT